MLLLFAAALAAEPTITARWSGGSVRLEVVPPPGEHVNIAAPASFSAGGAEVHGTGALAWARLPISRERMDVRAELPLCTDSGSACRVVAVFGTVDGAKRSGKQVLSVLGPPAREVVLPGQAVRVYDFAAVWCPPCNQMRAEFLDVPERMARWRTLELVPVDVDRAESWPLKSRYHVGGYPTLVAVDETGAEVDRYVGFEGVESLGAWFAGLRSVTPIAHLEAGPPAGVDTETAGHEALRLVRAQREEAGRAWLVAAGDTRDAHYARLLLDPKRADADWLVANDPTSPWLPDALAAFPELWPKVASRVPEFDSADAAAAFDAYAAKASPEAALVARVAFTTLVRQRVTDDPESSRGHVVDLADGYASIGDLPRALTLLARYKELYPGEFTWDFTAARLLLDQKRYAEAETHGRAALDLAWGDQRLRAVVRLARAVDGQGRRADAIVSLKAELAASPAPGADAAVRTTRYRSEVEALLHELGG